ncbi:MAG: prepilin peptidase [Acidimicrobiia bacterium]|nr:prepilin peptidase [Acidimicrobiia bacterium]MYC45758.1 prepilin peptidase [Acidimicrobiia bacterium]
MIAPALVLAALVVWAAAGVRLAVIDFRSRILPTRLIWSAAGAVWVLYTAASLVEGVPEGLVGAAIGGAACGGALAVVHFSHPPSMGFGDVRLGVLNGLLCGWWGWQAALLGLMAGFLLALPEAVVTLVREGPRAGRPLGPYLIAGAAAVTAWSAVSRGLVPFA